MQQKIVNRRQSWRHKWLAWGLLAGLAATGCGYGEITPHAYEYAMALYSICNRRDAARLEEFAKLLEADAQAGQLGDREADWLRTILDDARAGEWSDAQASARQLLEDQVRGR
jgi:hypothetical protein